MRILFRRIRKKLIDEHRLKKYGLYAVGEIFLVMIGILLALQVSNWNENRNKTAVEIETLKELKAGLISDFADIQFNLESHRKAKKSCDILLAHFERNLPYQDSLDAHFGTFLNYSILISSTGPFETLKSKGMEILKNDKLRLNIAKIYDFNYEYITEKEKMDQLDFEENKKYILQHFKDWELGVSATPINYSEIAADLTFRNRLNYTSQIRKTSIERYQITIANCRRLIKDIETEIHKLQGTKKVRKKKRVRFTLPGHDTAKVVVLTGSFAYWDTEALFMEYKDGEWIKDIELLSDTFYLYKFIVDGVWLHDENNPENEPDGQGGLNSIRYVPAKPQNALAR